MSPGLDFQAILSAILHWRWKQAFAIALGSLTTLLLAKNDRVDGAGVLMLTWLAAVSAWFLVALILELAGKSVWRCGAATVTAATTWWQKRIGRRRAVQNLDQLDSNETESLCWIYHRHNRRVRADTRFSDIAALLRHGILESESPEPAPETWDRILLINPVVWPVLKERFGERNPKWGGSDPPWRRIILSSMRF